MKREYTRVYRESEILVVILEATYHITSWLPTTLTFLSTYPTTLSFSSSMTDTSTDVGDT
jgi:hypothetical protein